MKLLYKVLFLFLCTSVALAQNSARVMIEGQLIVPKGGDPEGIVIYNTTSEKGTITDRTGVFTLAVANQDEILVQSLQFTPVTVKVNRGILNSKKMTISLRETVTPLEEIVVSPYDLTGDIVADVNRVNVNEGAPNINFAAVNMLDGTYDSMSAPENVALDDATWKYGLNFVNIFKALYNKREKDSTTFEITAEDELAKMYDNVFFKQNLDIKEENIGDFLDYAANNGLNKEMLEQGNELNLIQFLLNKREAYKAQVKN
tara:strand:- start:48541 stop:49317 length:777 start_codon:yes stop_codon:yes gene_type:complete